MINKPVKGRMAYADWKTEQWIKASWTLIAVLILCTTVGAFGDNNFFGYYKETRAFMRITGWAGFIGFVYGLWKFSQDAPTTLLARALFIAGPMVFAFFATGFKIFN